MMRRKGGTKLVQALHDRMSVPVIVAPMFLVSSVELVVEACRAGLIGSMPTLNARSVDVLDRCLSQIADALRGTAAAPFAMNLVAHRSNERFDPDLDLIAKHRVPIVISSVGSPVRCVEKSMNMAGSYFLMLRAWIMRGGRQKPGWMLLCCSAAGLAGTQGGSIRSPSSKR